ncbi:MAG: acyl-CoA reductase [Bacteroidota bacterium]|nr:acyl-CoA reductase [Bacteroidota bacterium]
MTLEQRIQAWIQLGNELRSKAIDYEEITTKTQYYNQWFTKENILISIAGICKLLEEKSLRKWVSGYNLENIPSKKIGVVMAGNIPCVGFHDMLCVTLAGHELHAKKSSDDPIFPELIINRLIEIEPQFKNKIQWRERMHDIEAIIATGTNNSAMHFNYYFSKIPRIIRKNRTSIAIITGNETKEDLQNLGKDVFTYFGLGCRNVSKLLVPQGYKFDSLFEALYPYHTFVNHKKYINNYEYQRAIYLMNSTEFLDNNFLIIKQDEGLHSPVGVLYHQSYTNSDDILDFINKWKDKIQCIVLAKPTEGQVKMGETQFPEVNQYADNVDTMKFLTSL